MPKSWTESIVNKSDPATPAQDCGTQNTKMLKMQVVYLNKFYNSAYCKPAGIFEVINNNVEGIFQKKTQEHNLIQYQKRLHFYYNEYSQYWLEGPQPDTNVHVTR